MTGDLESDFSDTETGETEEQQVTYNPNPLESAPTTSLDAVEVVEHEGPNVLFFGLNNEGSCGEQASKHSFTLVNQEYEQ